jgi:drug/metabolite transporter (DMT)-like permease
MKLKIWTAMLAVYVVWGSTYLAIRFAVETMPPFWMAAVRFLVSGAILYAWRRMAGDPPPTRRQWRSAAIVGLFLLLGGNGGVVWAEQRVDSGIAALLVGAVPLFMVALEALRSRRDRQSSGLTWQALIGVLVGFSGIILLTLPDGAAGASLNLDMLGIIALLFASFFWAVGSLYSRTADLPASPLLGTGMEMLAGGAGLFVFGALTGDGTRLDLAAISPASVWGLLYLIFFGSLVGFTAYTWLLRNAPTPLVSTYAYVNPLVAILLGAVVLNEPLTGRVLLSALIIIGSVVVINTSRQARLRQVEPAPASD